MTMRARTPATCAREIRFRTLPDGYIRLTVPDDSVVRTFESHATFRRTCEQHSGMGMHRVDRADKS